MRAAQAARREAVARIAAAQTRALDAVDAFQAEFDRCLQDLSMREGLGQKYGGPRRNAQERIRSQAAWSAAAAAAIGADLDALEALCDAEPGVPVPAGGAGGGGGAMVPVSARVRALLVALRTAMDARARFLGVRAPAPAPRSLAA